MGKSGALDSHGCNIAEGKRWCATLDACVDEFDQCDPGAGDVASCSYEWAGLSWDLAPLKREAHYVVEDVAAAARGDDETRTQYVFAVCGDVDPTAANPACETTAGTARETTSASAPAYQVMTTEYDYTGDGSVWSFSAEECYRAGASTNEANTTQWGLLDPQAPSAGVFLRYYGGNTCSATSPTARDGCDYEIGGWTYCRRSTKINFVCNNHITEISKQLVIKEGAGCAQSDRRGNVAGRPRHR